MAWVNLCSFSDFERFLPSDKSGMIRTCFDLLQVCLGHIFFVRKTFLKSFKHTQCISMLMYVNVTMIYNNAIKSEPQKAH